MKSFTLVINVSLFIFLVIYDVSGQSKGFAFVRFCSEDEYKDAMVHMNGFTGLGQKALKVSFAVPKKQQQYQEM